MTGSLRSHGVREIHHNETSSDFHVEEVRNVGYTVITDAVRLDDLSLIRERIDRIYEQQVRELGGEAQLKRINDAKVARCLLGYDDFFVELVRQPMLVAVLKRLLGEVFTLMSQNGIINDSEDEHYQTTWHRDLNYQHFVSSRPLAVSALYCIDEFSAESGATMVLPASHKSEEFPSADYVLHHQTMVVAPAGSIIIFDAMLFHRTGDNTSGRVRRAVNHIFTLPLIKQQISIPRMLRGKFRDDPFLRTCLGYAFETGESVQHWREHKLEQMGS